MKATQRIQYTSTLFSTNYNRNVLKRMPKHQKTAKQSGFS